MREYTTGAEFTMVLGGAGLCYQIGGMIMYGFTFGMVGSLIAIPLLAIGILIDLARI